MPLPLFHSGAAARALRALTLLGVVASPAALPPRTAQAQTTLPTGPIGQIISYQGQLSSPDGKPVANGTQTVSFSIQEAGSTTALFSTSQSVATVGGVFNTFLGIGAVAFDPAKSYTLTVSFGNQSATHPIAAVPVAVSAQTAGNVSGVVAIANGGTGSATQTFVDTSTAQTVGGAKTFSDALRGNSSLLATGTFGSGSIPAQGAGERMMWYPRKAAFRAGSVDGTQWDDANIGDFSMATGQNTKASGSNSTAMGSFNTASGSNSRAMGTSNIASGRVSTAMGDENTASGSGSMALGVYNRASGPLSTAIGYRATASHDYSFVVGLTSLLPTLDTFSDRASQFKVHAPGGFTFLSGNTSGVELAAGSGTWSTLSDRNAKDRFGAINPREVLRKVNALPLSSWHYKGNPSRHIGPMAQDFRAAFGLGLDERHIDSVDVDGVALAAIQGLNAEIKVRDAKITALETANAAFEGRLKKLEARR